MLFVHFMQAIQYLSTNQNKGPNFTFTKEFWPFHRIQQMNKEHYRVLGKLTIRCEAYTGLLIA